MAQIIDPDPYSNSYFFITGFSDIFGAGKNSFVINCTNKVVLEEDINVFAYDAIGNSLPVSSIKTLGPLVASSNFGKVFVVNVLEDTPNGIGKVEVNGMGVNTGEYTGSIAYYEGQAYRVNKNTRLPLIQPPSASPLTIEPVKWSRNILIDTSRSTTSQLRFFDLPNINITPQLYYSTNYPNSTYKLASGSCAAISIVPKNNASGDFDQNKINPIYQLYTENSVFSSSMQGEKIRIKNPYVKNFIYSNYSNNQIEFEGTINTDFIATIEKVVNSTTLLVNMPFMTVGDIVNRTNEDSEYAKNNLVKIFGYNINNNAEKQTTYMKRNFYVLSISSAEYEIFYKDFSNPLSLSTTSTVKSLIDVEFNLLRAHCGNADSYKIYGKSLNSPEDRTLLKEGRIEADELLIPLNFKSGMFNHAGKFYNQAFLNEFWLKTGGSVTLTQTSSVYIDGAYIGHSANTNESDYVIFKDNTTGGSRTATYSSFTFDNKSYWYAKSDAFLNDGVYPTASYTQISNIPTLSSYVNSVENLTTGGIHDSNPIKLRGYTLYALTMNVRPDTSNTDASNLKIYFSGSNGPNGNGGERLIGTVDSNFNFGESDLFSSTFFVDASAYGTIKIVPITGNWYISNISLKPYKSLDYSIDSFSVKIPMKIDTANELYEIEAELYDAGGKLAYGRNYYSSDFNKLYVPLKKNIFLDPSGQSI